ncbi:MAG: hypothetical protein ACI92S_001286, partial [Planctomycetaceae bacterium]
SDDGSRNAIERRASVNPDSRNIPDDRFDWSA